MEPTKAFTPFCTLRRYKLKCVWDLHQKKQVGLKRGIHRQPRLIPGPTENEILKVHKGVSRTWDQLVSVPNFSWMVVILVRRHVPMLDNGGTGLTDPRFQR